MLKLKIEGGIYMVSFHKTNKLNYLFTESLREELVKMVSKPGREVVLSMKGIDFVDSSGFEAIMTAVHRANEIGCRFRISNVSSDVYELLQLRKFKILFEINPVQANEFAAVV